MGYEETGRVSYAKSTADRVAEYSRNSYRLANDIAPIPKVANRRRRNRCKKSLRLFAETYFPERFTLKWSPDHLDFISHLEDRITEGGYKAQAMPRGSGKSSLVIPAAEWAALYGFRQYLFLIAVSDSKAKTLIESNPGGAGPVVIREFHKHHIPLWTRPSARGRKPSTSPIYWTTSRGSKEEGYAHLRQVINAE